MFDFALNQGKYESVLDSQDQLVSLSSSSHTDKTLARNWTMSADLLPRQILVERSRM